MDFVRFLVITEIAAIYEDTPGVLWPNLCDETVGLVNGFLVADVLNMDFSEDAVIDYEPGIMELLRDKRLKMPVFRLGEILIVDRERSEYGTGRKPWKFSVKWREFETLAGALLCQKEILGWMTPREYKQFKAQEL